MRYRKIIDENKYSLTVNIRVNSTFWQNLIETDIISIEEARRIKVNKY